MIKIIITFLFHIFLLFNVSLVASESDEKLRIGLLAPFSGEYKNLGESLLLSTQLALDEIDNDNIIIIPRDSGTENEKKLNRRQIIKTCKKIYLFSRQKDEITPKTFTNHQFVMLTWCKTRRARYFVLFC